MISAWFGGTTLSSDPCTPATSPSACNATADMSLHLGNACADMSPAPCNCIAHTLQLICNGTADMSPAPCNSIADTLRTPFHSIADNHRPPVTVLPACHWPLVAVLLTCRRPPAKVSLTRHVYAMDLTFLYTLYTFGPILQHCPLARGPGSTESASAGALSAEECKAEPPLRGGTRNTSICRGAQARAAEAGEI